MLFSVYEHSNETGRKDKFMCGLNQMKDRVSPEVYKIISQFDIDDSLHIVYAELRFERKIKRIE